jgi:uncharacterized membrane protein
MNKILQRLNFFGYYQIVGGVLGVFMALYALFTLSVLPSSVLMIFMAGLGLQSFSIYCGYLIYKQQYEKALNLSIVNQFLQILNVNILGFSFFYSSGFFLSPSIDLTGDIIARFNFGISTFTLGLNKNHEITEIGFNIVAFVMVNMLFSVKAKFEKHMKENVEAIGQ